MENIVSKLVIVGSGPAALTAAVYASRANLKPSIFEGKNPGGQLMSTTAVENWPGIKSIMGPKLIENMTEHARSLGTIFFDQEIVRVDFSKRPFLLWTDRDKQIKSEAVILATGATARKLACPGEDKYWARGVSTCAVCDGALYKNGKAVIVGGGDTAMEDASFMTKFTDNITIIHRRDKLTASIAMQQRIISNSKVSIIYNSTVTEIKGNGDKVTDLVVTNQLTGEEQNIAADVLFIAIGFNPNSSIFKGQLELDKGGYVKLFKNTESSISGIFVAGDLADPRYRQVVTAAGEGCKAALDAERFLSVGNQ